jgi:hypothetical protein
MKAAVLLAMLCCISMAAQKKAAPKPEEMTGCVDEQAGPKYVLRDDDLRLIAVLEPDGFDVEQFARYMGERVTVSGRLVPGTPPVFRVKSVRRLAASCKTETQAAVSGEESSAAMGCIDEQPGPRYVLRSDDRARVLMELEADGFAVENFARYLGAKVEVRGRTRTENGRTVMRVRTVEKIAGRCGPE